VSCAAFLSENVFVDLPGDRVRLRYHVRPMEDMNRRELALLAGDQVKKILFGRLFGPGGGACIPESAGRRLL